MTSARRRTACRAMGEKKAREGDPGTIAAIEAWSAEEKLDLSWFDQLAEHEVHVPNELTPEETRKGKRDALELMDHYGVFTPIPRGDSAGMK